MKKKRSGTDYTRNKVRVRDNYTCQDCGVIRTPEDVANGLYKKMFDVHHLNGLCGKKSQKYDRVSDIDILITLCHKCHFNRPEHTLRSKEHIEARKLIHAEKYKDMKQMRADRYTFREIGEKYGVTKQNVQQLLQKI